MAFHDVQFPTDISYGSATGPGFKTLILESPSGAEERIGLMTQPRHRFDVRYGIATWEDLLTVKKFYLNRYGALHSFRFKDWIDYTTHSDGHSAHTATDQIIGVGDGSTKIFACTKTYSDGFTTIARRIVKPISSTVKVSVNGVEQTNPGWTYAWSVSGDGEIVFTTAPVTGNVTWGGEFDVHARFSSESDEWLRTSLSAFQHGDINNIYIVEVLGDLSVEDAFYWGGSETLDGLLADKYLGRATQRVVPVGPTGSGKKIYLPPKASLEMGGPRYILINTSGTYTVAVHDVDSGSSLFTLGTNESITVVLGYDGSGLRKWYGL